ncbi:MAG: DUF1593 domain-containing protein, partial [Rubrivivax sp.]|nr:DUF1593 domain-containing protein [Rubrivivax sp.]
VTATGQPAYGMAAVSHGKSTPGSRLLLAAADKADDRPLWVTVWGGANTLAQALFDARREHFQHDFAERLDWCVAGEYNQSNHNPVAVLNGDSTKRLLEITARPGETVTLSAAGSRDPDEDALELSWWIYPEASSLRDAKGRSFPPEVKLTASRGASTSLPNPTVSKSETIQVILEVRDTGTPSLWAYRRAIIRVQP